MVLLVPQLDDGVLGQSLLDRITIFQVFEMTIPGNTIGINQAFHGNDGPSATQFISVLDGHSRHFDDSMDSCTAGFVAFTMTIARRRV